MTNEFEKTQVVSTPQTSLVPPVDLNLLNQQATQLEAKMKVEGIEEIKYKNGPHATHDSEKNETIIAGSNTIIHKTDKITTIKVINEGVTPKEALVDLQKAGNTQKQIGSATGTSQQQVSVDLSEQK